jgi:hypothetical protein
MRTHPRSSVGLRLLFLIGFAICPESDITPGAIAGDPTASQGASALPLPNEIDSVQFGVIGDFGTGDPAQYQRAEQMASLRQRFKYEFVVTVGDNLYGSAEPGISGRSSNCRTSRSWTPA